MRVRNKGDFDELVFLIGSRVGLLVGCMSARVVYSQVPDASIEQPSQSRFVWRLFTARRTRPDEPVFTNRRVG